MLPCDYEEELHRQMLRESRKNSQVTVYDAIFFPVSGDCEPILIACTSTGYLHVFLLASHPTLSRRANGEREKDTDLSPHLSILAHASPIYSLAFAGDHTNPLLISGADDCFRVWRYNDLLRAIFSSSTDSVSSIGTYHLPQRATDCHGGRFPYDEINAMASSQMDPIKLWIAGGDSNAHEFDLSVSKYVQSFQGHSEYLHDIRYLEQSSQIVTASEDSTVCIFDVKSGKQNKILTLAESSSASFARALAVNDSECWLACGGANRNEGFIQMYHLPTLLPTVSHSHLHSQVHALSFHKNDVLSVGNDAHVRRWNSQSEAMLSDTTSNRISSFQFCAVDPMTNITAVGGHAQRIDIHIFSDVYAFSALADPLKAECHITCLE